MGIFDELFDFNQDGKLDEFERATRNEILSSLQEDSDEEEDDELDSVGLGRDELEWMDEDERREALEDAGLDPDDFDF